MERLSLWRENHSGDRPRLPEIHAECVRQLRKAGKVGLETAGVHPVIQHRPGKANVVADALSRLPRKKKAEATAQTADQTFMFAASMEARVTYSWDILESGAAPLLTYTTDEYVTDGRYGEPIAFIT
jgi:hypothetical protein